MEWQKNLLDWYAEHKRDFPWRKTKDPYHIWLSEIIMQQTRTQQGLPYYQAFASTFPSVEKLAKADEDTVLKLWQGLGYYSRARNMHATAQFIAQELNGIFPPDFESIKELKGVGDYTASAIASIAFDIPQAVVDGNVYRVYARFFGIDLPINTPAAFKHFKEIAQQSLPKKDPGTFNQAVMELGALECVPQNPNCQNCPLVKGCKAFQLQLQSQLPVKPKKNKIRKRFFHYLVFENGDNKKYFLQRKASGIWHKLYEFPLVELDRTLKKPTSSLEEAIRQFTKASFKVEQIGIPLVHKLSHQHIEISFWKVQTSQIELKGYTQKEWEQLAVPVPIANFLERREP